MQKTNDIFKQFIEPNNNNNNNKKQGNKSNMGTNSQKNTCHVTH